MKLDHPLVMAWGGLLATAWIRRWMGTLEYRVAYYDATVDPAHPECPGRMLYVFWHEYILVPAYMRGHCDLTMLVSRHRDAEILVQAARHLGFSCVRGSTNRGGATALRELAECSRFSSLTITPDGPRGPRRAMSLGPIFLASRLEMPLVPLGLGCDRPWRLSSWDRFAIPRPWSRCRGVVGPPLRLPPNLDRDGLEHYRQQVERLLNRLTQEAEEWAARGDRRENEQPARPAHRNSKRFIQHAAHASGPPRFLKPPLASAGSPAITTCGTRACIQSYIRTVG